MSGIDRYSGNTQVTYNDDGSDVTKNISEWADADGTGTSETFSREDVEILLADMLGKEDTSDDAVQDVLDEIIDYLNEQTDIDVDTEAGSFQVPDYILADLLDIDGDGDLDGEDKSALDAADGDENTSTNIFLENSTGYSATPDGIDYNQDGEIDITADDEALGEVDGWLDDNGMIDPTSGIAEALAMIKDTNDEYNVTERTEALHKVMYALVLIGVTDTALEAFHTKMVGVNDDTINSSETLANTYPELDSDGEPFYTHDDGSPENVLDSLLSALSNKDDVRQQGSVVSEIFGDFDHSETTNTAMSENARAVGDEDGSGGGAEPTGPEPIEPDPDPESEDSTTGPGTTETPETPEAGDTILEMEGAFLDNFDGADTDPVSGDILVDEDHRDDLETFFEEKLGLTPEDATAFSDAIFAVDPQLDFHTLYSYLDGGATGLAHGTEITYSDGTDDIGGSTTVGDGVVTTEEALFALAKIAYDTDDITSTLEDAPTEATYDSGSDSVAVADGLSIDALMPDEDNLDTVTAALGDETTTNVNLFSNYIVDGASDDTSTTDSNDDTLDSLDIAQLNRLAAVIFDTINPDANEDVDISAAHDFIDAMLALDTVPSLEEMFKMLDGEIYDSSDSSWSDDGDDALDDADAAINAMRDYITEIDSDADIDDLMEASEDSISPAPSGDQGGDEITPIDTITPAPGTDETNTADEISAIETGDELAAYLTTGDAGEDDVDISVLLSSGDDITARLADFMENKLVISQGQSENLAEAMANQGMTIEQLIDLFDGGATGADNVDVKYNDEDADTFTAGDGNLDVVEGQFALNAFMEEFNAVNPHPGMTLIDDANKATYTPDGGTEIDILASEAAVPRNDDEDYAYLSLKDDVSTGTADSVPIEKVEDFLENVEGGTELQQKRAIRDLLEIMGVTSAKGLPIAVGDPLIEKIYDDHEGDLTGLAESLEGDTDVTNASVEAYVNLLISDTDNDLAADDYSFSDASSPSTEGGSAVGEVTEITGTADPEIKDADDADRIAQNTNLDRYLLTGDTGNKDVSGGDDPIAENDAVMARLSEFIFKYTGAKDGQADNIVIAMANQGMTVNQIVELLDGGSTGAEDETEVTYNNSDDQSTTTATVGDDSISKEEAEFGLNAFIREYTVDGGTMSSVSDVNLASYDDKDVWTGEAVVPRNYDEDAAYNMLDNNVLSEPAGETSVSKVKSFLRKAEDGDALTQKRAIRDLLEIMGVTSEDDMPLPVNDALVAHIYDTYSGDDNALSSFADAIKDASDPDSTIIDHDSTKAFVQGLIDQDNNRINQAAYTFTSGTSGTTDAEAETTIADEDADIGINDLEDDQYIMLPSKSDSETTAADINFNDLSDDNTTVGDPPASDIAGAEDGLAKYVRFGNYESTGDLQADSNQNGTAEIDEPLSEYPKMMARLARIMSSLLGEVEASDAKKIVAAMASQGMSAAQVIDLLDGGATGAAMGAGAGAVDYGNDASAIPGDNIITAAEAKFGLDVFINEYNTQFDSADDRLALIDTVTPPAGATYGTGNPKTTILPAYASVPRSAFEQNNYDLLKEQMEDDVAAVEDVENFLATARNGTEMVQKRAIRDLLEIMGVTSQDGSDLPLGNGLIDDLYNSYDGDDIIDLAEYLANTVNDGHDNAQADDVITKESATSKIWDRISDDDDEADILFTSSVEDSSGNPITVPGAINSSTEFYNFMLGNDDDLANYSTIESTKVPKKPAIPRLAAMLSLRGGIPPEDATLIATQITNEGMDLYQIYSRFFEDDVLEGDDSVIMGDPADLNIDFDRDTGGESVHNSALTRWALADYVEKRKDAPDADPDLSDIEISVPDAVATSDGRANSGLAKVKYDDHFKPGDGQEVMNEAMGTAYSALYAGNELQADQVTYTNLNAIWNAANPDGVGNNAKEAQQRTALIYILDIMDIDKASGMPLDIHDPMVTALLNKGGTDGNNFEKIMDFLANGTVDLNNQNNPSDSVDTPIEVTTMYNHAATLMDKDVDGGTEDPLVSETTEADIAMGNTGQGTDQAIIDEAIDMRTGDNPSSSLDSFLSLFREDAEYDDILSPNDDIALASFLVGYAQITPDNAEKLSDAILNTLPAPSFQTLYSYFDGGAANQPLGTVLTYGDAPNEVTDTVGDGTLTQESVLFALGKINKDASSPVDLSVLAIAPAAPKVDGNDIYYNDAVSLGNSHPKPADLSVVSNATFNSGNDTVAQNSDHPHIFANYIVNALPGGQADTETGNAGTLLNTLDSAQTNRLIAFIEDKTTGLDPEEIKKYILTMNALTPSPPSLADVFNMLDGKTHTWDSTSNTSTWSNDGNNDGNNSLSDDDPDAASNMYAYLVGRGLTPDANNPYGITDPNA